MGDARARWGAAARCALVAATWVMLGCGSAVSVCGCYPYDCAEHIACGEPGAPEGEVAPEAPGAPPSAPDSPGGAPCGDDPIDAAPTDGCGVFASSSLGDDANPGTRALPVRTMRRAIERSRQGARRVYACAETFPEAVEIPAGAEIRGGLDCARGWTFIGDHTKTVLAPEPDLIPLRLEGGSGASVVADVLAQAADAAQPGGSSIAALVLPGATVTFLRSALVAGRGAPGEDGEDGGDGAAASGADGHRGGDACSADVVAGAPAAATTCDDGDTIGGAGGDGAVSSGDDGRGGLPEPISNAMGWGQAGEGQTAGADCTDGRQGNSGSHGAQGRGAAGRGMITRAGWEGIRGTDGAGGLFGQGGGGGGGTLGGVMFCGMSPALPKGGASGGSGGGGGCGGRGGRGGGYGGASIALISLSDGVTLHDTTLAAADGGDGGRGGAGQIGGEGGSRGTGGAARSGSLRGCDGGRGGQGGNGGHGGGGLGGPSIGIAYLLDPPKVLGTLSLGVGEPGKGGAGGRADLPELAGQAGAGAEMLGFVQ
ncbi:hypothetical protein [Sorangium sp. So ce131]|uniref:hypothetical protein n=1 Tax=Sorangium sp. So ce131 TaxID=3133282 RepID=UPI003F6398B4